MSHYDGPYQASGISHNPAPFWPFGPFGRGPAATVPDPLAYMPLRYDPSFFGPFGCGAAATVPGPSAYMPLRYDPSFFGPFGRGAAATVPDPLAYMPLRYDPSFFGPFGRGAAATAPDPSAHMPPRPAPCRSARAAAPGGNGRPCSAPPEHAYDWAVVAPPALDGPIRVLHGTLSALPSEGWLIPSGNRSETLQFRNFKATRARDAFFTPHLRVGGYCADADPRLLPFAIFLSTGIQVVALQQFRQMYGLVLLQLSDPVVEIPEISAVLHDRALMTRAGIYLVRRGAPMQETVLLQRFAAQLEKSCRQPRHLMTATAWKDDVSA